MSALIIPCGCHAAYEDNEMQSYFRMQRDSIEGCGAVWNEVLNADYEVYLEEQANEIHVQEDW